MLRNILTAGVFSQLLQSAHGGKGWRGGAVPRKGVGKGRGPPRDLRDPRPGKALKTVKLIGFYYPDRKEKVDKACNFPEGGNFYPNFQYAANAAGDQATFHNAEAAFQALKWWDDKKVSGKASAHSTRSAFSRATSGAKAFGVKKAHKGTEDFSFAGHGNNWAGMKHVLAFKFSTRNPKGAMQQALINTGDAFLQEHNAVRGRDTVWSDNVDGDGTNWLGVQLMLQRDRLTGQTEWTNWLNTQLDTSTGAKHPRNHLGKRASLVSMVKGSADRFKEKGL